MIVGPGSQSTAYLTSHGADSSWATLKYDVYDGQKNLGLIDYHIYVRCNGGSCSQGAMQRGSQVSTTVPGLNVSRTDNGGWPDEGSGYEGTMTASR